MAKFWRKMKKKTYLIQPINLGAFRDQKPNSGTENLTKSRLKKVVKSNKSISRKKISLLAVLNFLPVQKLIFGGHI